MTAETTLKQNFGINEIVYRFCEEAESSINEKLQATDAIAEYNQYKVLHAMQKNNLSDAHFSMATGYGYQDPGRDVLENIYAQVFHTEDALVRPQIMSGTHALTVALFGNLRPGDEILSPVGKPYDTLEKVIGIRNESGSLADFGIQYRQVDLKADDAFDWDGIKSAMNKKTKLVTIQRSKGYAWRDSFTIDKLKELISFIKEINPHVICMVDNCYGEFVETEEPSDAGADLVVGSLIKNPGGGLAYSGGYIAGKKDYVEQAAKRLSSPGLGKEVGASLGLNRQMIQGFFMAPVVVSGSVKGAMLASKVFEMLGFAALPAIDDVRADIVQAIKLQSAEKVIAFCEGVQKAAPVDCFVKPVPGDMPGYTSPVIMACGSFVEGSSIELSADAPLREPYIVYLQGGLSYAHAKLGVMMGLQALYDQKLVTL